MRTTIDIPEALVREAMVLTKITTKTELVKHSLENIIQQQKLRDLTNYYGKVNLNIDLNKMRNR